MEVNRDTHFTVCLEAEKRQEHFETASGGRSQVIERHSGHITLI